MLKKVLLFAPGAFDLSRTTRTIEIAKEIVSNNEASRVFDIQFISISGDLEYLIRQNNFPL